MADNIHDTQPGKKRGRVGDPIQVKFTSGDEVKHLLVPAGADDSQVWQSINNGTDKPAIPMRFTSGEEAKNIFVPSGAGEAQLGEAIRNGHPVAKAPAVSAPPPPPPLSYPPPIEQAHAAPQPGLWQRFKTMIGLGPERPSRSAEQVSHDLAWGHVTSQPGPQAFAQAGSDLAAWQAANPVRVEPVPYLGPNISNETRHVRLPDPHVDPRPLDLRTNYGRLPEDVGKVPSASAPAPKHPVGIVWENGLPVERELADVTRHVPLNSNP